MVIPHKFFSLATIRVLSRTYVQNLIKFDKKLNGSQEIEKMTTRQTKKYHKMASRRGRLHGENFFSVVSIAVIQQASLQTFMRKDLTALNK